MHEEREGSPGRGNSPGNHLKGEAMSNIVEKGGYFDMAEALVFGEMMIR